VCLDIKQEETDVDVQFCNVVILSYFLSTIGWSSQGSGFASLLLFCSLIYCQLITKSDIDVNAVIKLRAGD